MYTMSYNINEVNIMSNLNIRIDDDVKKDAEVLFANLGLNMSTAINMFLRQSIRDNGIPFMITAEQPNKTTIEAIEEARKIGKSNSKGFNSIESFKDSLGL